MIDRVIAGEIAELPVIDAHCHHFTARNQKLPGGEWLARLLCIGAPGSADWPRDYALAQPGFKRFVKELARFLRCKEDPEEVVSARNAEAAPSYAAYVGRLLGDAGIAQLLLDLGFPGPESYPEFEALTAVPHRKILRIDTLISQLIRERTGFSDFTEGFEERIRAGVRDGGVVALKSYIAGKTGLGVEPVCSAEAAAAEYGDFVAGGGLLTKAFNDFVFLRAAGLCIELDVPLQVHASVVGGSTIRMDLVRPSLLQPFLRHGRGRELKLVLVHGGFPWVEEAAMLAVMFPRVWLDTSLFSSFLPAAAAPKLLDILRLAPASRVLYASDAAFIPEMHWFTALIGREAVSRAADTLRREGFLTRAEALEAARLILAENARGLYRV